MILAAGLGTRLRPLTDRTPKPLIPVGGVPMLERVARRLIAAGADRLIVNTSHLGEQVEAFLRERDGFGVEWHVSPEPGEPLETGGALVHGEPLFRKDTPFFLHNSDILTDVPLAEMYRAHVRSGALATLAVMERDTARHLLFDDRGLMGRTDAKKGLDLRVRDAAGEVRKLAFGGIHVLSPRVFALLAERGAFSILDPYLRLAGAGETILPFRVDDCTWIDIGRPEQLEMAHARVGELRG
ncbi:nucleotidyltransferase family protein [Longimicrobium sp.]|uniref:nucleotidyltransferase family protein n=1 Tax=Longimicrobium sp. TaxID=2029185 RepID=UPI002C9ED68F|nr:nucleotidyltransferase family protein [Longimicrobium sp.]HSU13160.1 nucleotidyltransferase family protein [Longimicrobium sp.]